MLRNLPCTVIQRIVKEWNWRNNLEIDPWLHTFLDPCQGIQTLWFKLGMMEGMQITSLLVRVSTFDNFFCECGDIIPCIWLPWNVEGVRLKLGVQLKPLQQHIKLACRFHSWSRKKIPKLSWNRVWTFKRNLCASAAVFRSPVM